MRTFEILMACMLLAAVLWIAVQRVRHAVLVGLYCILLLAVCCAHWRLEGAHWQMVSIYFGVPLAIGLLLAPSAKKSWKVVGGAGVVLLVAGSCAASWVYPMFRLPQPTGPYAIGTRLLYMADTSRKEDSIPGSQRPRELMVQLWYPAEPSTAPLAPYRRKNETYLTSTYMSVNWTHSRWDAPMEISGKPHPVLLYNPGWGGRRTQNTFLIEELASHGYVVVTIDHPYNSSGVTMPDGRVITPIPSPELTDSVTPAATLYAIIGKQVARETDDTQFVLKQVETMNTDPASPLYRQLDMARLGTLGFSLGGMVAAETAYRNPQVRSVFIFDTPIYGEAGKHGLTQPTMFLSEELTHTSPEAYAKLGFEDKRDIEMYEYEYIRQLNLFLKDGDYQIFVPGSIHTSFQDSILYSPIKSISGVGDVSPQLMVNLTRQYCLAFFNHTLLGKNEPLLAPGAHPFPETRVVFGTNRANNAGDGSTSK